MSPEYIVPLILIAVYGVIMWVLAVRIIYLLLGFGVGIVLSCILLYIMVVQVCPEVVALAYRESLHRELLIIMSILFVGAVIASRFTNNQYRLLPYKV